METSVDVADVADNLSALANPVRIRILLALTGTRQPNWDHRGMSYSDLRAAVDVADGGRFNYHLNELRDQFVRGEDGHYWLTTPGTRVVDEMYADTFSSAHGSISGSVDWECPVDGAALEAQFDDGIITVTCPDHGVVFDMYLSFSSATGRELDWLFAWGNRHALQYLESVSWNRCPHCTGQFGQALFETVPVEETDRVATPAPAGETEVLVGMECQQCGVSFRVPAVQYTFTRPATIAFLHDHGIDYRSLDLEFGSADWTYESSEGDGTVLVRLQVDDETLEIELDRTLDTTSYRRLGTDGE